MILSLGDFTLVTDRPRDQFGTKVHEGYSQKALRAHHSFYRQFQTKYWKLLVINLKTKRHRWVGTSTRYTRYCSRRSQVKLGGWEFGIKSGKHLGLTLLYRKKNFKKKKKLTISETYRGTRLFQNLSRHLTLSEAHQGTPLFLGPSRHSAFWVSSKHLTTFLLCFGTQLLTLTWEV